MSLPLSRFVPDNFTLALIVTVALASVLPAQGQVGAVSYTHLTLPTKA